VNLSAVLVTGLFAGGVSCAAVQGGLLTGLLARQQAARAALASERAGEAEGSVDVLDPSTPPRWQARLADDLAPVGGFLAAKLFAYTLLGTLLGALGGVVQISLGVRTWVQLGAGIVIVVFGLAQLGVPGFRNIVVEPPQSWMRLVRRRARSQAVLAPAMLGLTTVLIPCGVTLSVEALALTSGSALSGAATMAVFIIGTSPLFALLGYAARRAVTAWRGRLAVLTGFAVLALGLYTFNGGLELSGSPYAASRLAETVGLTESKPDSSTVTVAAGHQTVVITASGGYSPRNVAVAAGVPTTLVVHSAGAEGCLRSLTFPSLGLQQLLPADGDTRIELGALQPGTIAYSCSMGMYTGTITVA